MAKITSLSTITTGYLSNAQINANFQAIVTAFDKTLSRDGSTPNTVTANIDMNSNQLINLVAPTSDLMAATKKYVDDNTSAAAVAASAASAAAALVSENNAAASESAAATSETNAATSETNAAASAASINLPTLVANKQGSFLVQNAADTGYDFLAQGTSGQVLTSAGADATPTWETETPHVWVLLETQEASTSSSIDFTSHITATYKDYVLTFDDVVLSGTATPVLRTSTDNGSSFDSTSNDYWYMLQRQADTGVVSSAFNKTNATEIHLSDTTTLTGALHSGRVDIFNPLGTTGCATHFIMTTVQSSGFDRQIGAGQRIAAADVDAIQFLASTSTVASGTFKLYGIK